MSIYVCTARWSVPSMLMGEFARYIADPYQRLLDMMNPPLSKFDIDAFSHPVEQGTQAVSRTPEVHFQTFVNVLIQRGDAESKCGVSQGRDGMPDRGVSEHG